jgi:CubicO group peptidase (beta-lactamase class C family)
MRTALLVATAALYGGLLFSAQGPAIRRLDRSSITPNQIDQTVVRLMSAAEVSGVGISIFNNGRVVYSKAYGFRDLPKKAPLTENSVFTGASLSKAAFAYMVMQMVNSKALDLDKPVHEYLPKPLPEYEPYRDLADDPRYKKITARMLLSHTSGFPNFRGLNPDLKLNINFEPGSRYAYSGEGIQLLQVIVETIANKPIQDLMRERVFAPLGMTRTSMVSEVRFEDDYASGHDEYGRSLGPQQRAVASAAGSMQTSLRDVTTFIQGVIDGKQLPRSIRESMLSPQIEILSKRQFPTLEDTRTEENKGIRLSYGLGWGLYWTPYGKAFFKEGHDEGFQHYAVVFDKPKDGIVIMTNSSNGEGIFKELLESLLGNSFTPIKWEGFTPYSERPPRKPLPVHKEISLAPALLDRLVGRYAIPPHVVLKVTRKDGHLQMQENEEAPGELFPEAELRFFTKKSDDVVTFELDNEGRVSRLVIHTGGRVIPVNRVH